MGMFSRLLWILSLSMCGMTLWFVFQFSKQVRNGVRITTHYSHQGMGPQVPIVMTDFEFNKKLNQLKQVSTKADARIEIVELKKLKKSIIPSTMVYAEESGFEDSYGSVQEDEVGQLGLQSKDIDIIQLDNDSEEETEAENNSELFEETEENEDTVNEFDPVDDMSRATRRQGNQNAQDDDDSSTFLLEGEEDEGENGEPDLFNRQGTSFADVALKTRRIPRHHGFLWDHANTFQNTTKMNDRSPYPKFSKIYVPRALTGKDLNRLKFDQYFSIYRVSSRVLPIMSQPTNAVNLKTDKCVRKCRRLLRRGDFVMGVKRFLAKNGAWLKIGKNEYAPLNVRQQGGVGLSVLMKLEARGRALSFLNNKAFELSERDCELVYDPQERVHCQKSQQLEAASFQILRDYDLLDLESTDPENHPVPKGLTFDERWKLMLEPMTYGEVCNSSVTWSRCTLYPYCSWIYSIDRGSSACLHDDAVEKSTVNAQLNAKRSRKYDFEDNPDDGKKYFVYQPSGGFNNQRMQFEIALTICRVLNRTCVAPHAAPHTNYYIRYNQLHSGKTVPMDRVFDFDRLREYVDVVSIPSDVSFLQWMDEVGDDETERFMSTPLARLNTTLTGKDWTVVMRTRDIHKWTLKDIRAKFQDHDKRFLYFGNRTMWGTIKLELFHPETQLIKRELAYTKQIKNLAFRLSNSMGVYNSIHVRRGDKVNEAGFSKIGRDAVWYGEKMQPYMEKTKRLYIATDEPSLEFFQPLIDQGYDIIRASNLNMSILMPFLKSFPRQMRLDVLGMVEQLICSYSYRFLGSFYSTYTLLVLRLRRKINYLALPTRLLPDGNVTSVMTESIKADPEFKSTCNPYNPEVHKFPC